MPDPIEVLITLPLADDLLESLNGVSPRLRLTVMKARKPEDIPLDVWQRTEVLYTHRILPPPEQAPNLRWLQFHWAGIDHAVSAPLMARSDLMITTLSGAAASQIAEYAVMMILALGHRLPDLLANQRRAEWPHDRWERFGPMELRDATAGIVGYGSIGRQVARLLCEFGTTILAAKRDAMHPEDSGYIPEGMGDPGGDFAHRIYPPQALASMFKECDFVVVTAPLTPETQGLIGARELAALKPTTFIVDMSRGGVIDHAALLTALRDQKIAGAALDVFPEEPLPPENPLWKLPNVILTPHISGNTQNYDKRAVALFSENLQRYLSGLPLYNLVPPGRGY